MWEFFLIISQTVSEDQSLKILVGKCKEEGIIAQLMCSDSLEKYYEKFGFQRFSVGMSKNTRVIND